MEYPLIFVFPTGVASVMGLMGENFLSSGKPCSFALKRKLYDEIYFTRHLSEVVLTSDCLCCDLS